MPLFTECYYRVKLFNLSPFTATRPQKARIHTGLHACTSGARLGNRSVFILDPRLCRTWVESRIFTFSLLCLSCLLCWSTTAPPRVGTEYWIQEGPFARWLCGLDLLISTHGQIIFKSLSLTRALIRGPNCLRLDWTRLQNHNRLQILVCKCFTNQEEINKIILNGRIPFP